MEQRTEEWKQARIGKLTASRFHEAIARVKSGWGASRANYLADLAVQRLTGVGSDGIMTHDMMVGTEREPDARAAYAFHTDNEVVEVGFIDHPRILMSGASPDGLVGTDGMVQFKCPANAQHLETLLGEAIAGKHMTQMQWEMATCDRQWCDYVSYNPNFPPDLQLHIRRVPRDHLMVQTLEAQALVFLDELNAKMDKLNALLRRNAA